MYPDIKPPFSHVEKLLIDFSKKDKPSIADFAAIQNLGAMYDRLDNYRIEASSMTNSQLKNESHNSTRLADHMRRAGDPRPSPRCDCHAIISGRHKEAILIRAILAWLMVRIDDPLNGCWLPRDWNDQMYMPNYLRNAVPHKRIHHKRYYEWMGSRINFMSIKTPEQLINALRLIRSCLQSGAVPPEVMPKTGT